MGRLHAALLAIVACAGTVSAQPKRDIRGLVVDSSFGVAIADVEILVSGSPWRSRSDERGRFRITGIDSGSYFIVARKTGFAPESLSLTTQSGRVSDVRFILRRVATLEEVDVSESIVSSRLQGFEHRRARKNGGQFITRDEIERRKPVVTSDLLRRMQGIRMVDSAGVTVAVSSRGPKMNRGSVVNCVLRVGVDGSVKEHGFAVNAIPPEEIYGIEVYSGLASLPTEFSSRRDASCGLIMIWTRTR